MKATLLGTRGSVGRAGPSTVEYGGDTSSVEVVASDGWRLVLDAGSGLLHLSSRLPEAMRRVDILLTHLHMDHIQGLGFFPPLRDPGVETHIWGPVSTTMGLAERLSRYLSPPLFPVRVRDLRGTVLHDIAPGTFELGPFRVTADLVCHPGPTLGFRVEADGASLAYMPDHEPALGHPEFPPEPRWTSGHDLAQGVDLLVHDSQYTDEEYAQRVGWGHSSLTQTCAFAELAGVGRLVTFHHDPEHGDRMLDEMVERARATTTVEVLAGTAGACFDV